MKKHKKTDRRRVKKHKKTDRRRELVEERRREGFNDRVVTEERYTMEEGRCFVRPSNVSILEQLIDMMEGGYDE